MKWKLKFLLLLLFASLFFGIFSAPAMAVEGATAQWTTDLRFTQGSGCTLSTGSPDYIANNGSTECSIYNFTVYGSNMANGWAVDSNSYIEYIFALYNYTNNNSNDAYFERINQVLNASTSLSIVDINGYQIDASSSLLKILVKANSSGTMSGFTRFDDLKFTLQPGEVLRAMRATKWIISSNDVSAVVNAINQNKATIDEILVQLNWNNNLTNVQLEELRKIVASSNGTVEAINNINDNQQQAGEQAQSDADQASNQAQSDADQATATMFQTLGDIVGAFKDTPATDCTINGDLGHVNMGTLNFCQGEIGPLRPIIRAVLYLAMSVATYKILMWVVGAIAGLVNWVQTGGKE